MKKINKILSTILSFCVMVTPVTLVAHADDPATVWPTGYTNYDYHFTGMGRRWQQAKRTEKAAAQYFGYNGPGTSWFSYNGTFTDKKDLENPNYLILLNNGAAREELIKYYERKGLVKHVAVLREHSTDNLFLIRLNDLLEISKTVTLLTEYGMRGSEEANDGWCQYICAQSTLKATPEAIEDEIAMSRHPYLFAEHRDLRSDTPEEQVGKAYFAWESKMRLHIALFSITE